MYVTSSHPRLPADEGAPENVGIGGLVEETGHLLLGRQVLLAESRPDVGAGVTEQHALVVAESTVGLETTVQLDLLSATRDTCAQFHFRFALQVN